MCGRFAAYPALPHVGLVRVDQDQGRARFLAMAWPDAGAATAKPWKRPITGNAQYMGTTHYQLIINQLINQRINTLTVWSEN